MHLAYRNKSYFILSWIWAWHNVSLSVYNQSYYDYSVTKEGKMKSRQVTVGLICNITPAVDIFSYTRGYLLFFISILLNYYNIMISGIFFYWKPTLGNKQNVP